MKENQQQLEEDIRAKVMRMVQSGALHDPRLTSLVITAVKLTPDRSRATLYVRSASLGGLRLPLLRRTPPQKGSSLPLASGPIAGGAAENAMQAEQRTRKQAGAADASVTQGGGAPQSMDRDLMRALSSAKGRIRKSLSSTMRLRRFPELVFVWDEAIDRGERISSILNSLG